MMTHTGLGTVAVRPKGKEGGYEEQLGVAVDMHRVLPKQEADPHGDRRGLKVNF